LVCANFLFMRFSAVISASARIILAASRFALTLSKAAL